MRRAHLVAALSLLAGCASYQPAPLDTGLTPPPTAAILSMAAARIDRPFLKAEAIDLSRPLTPNALAVIAVLENFDLKALRAKTGVTMAQSFAARLLPDPIFQGSFDKLLSGPDPLDAFAASLGLDLQVLRTARVVRQANAAGELQVRLDLAWAEWQAAGAARLQGARVAALEPQIALARASAAAAQSLLERSSRAARRGDISGGDVDSRRLAALDTADRLRVAERDLAAARLELNKALGLPPETVLRLAAAAPLPPPPDAAALTALASQRRLDLQALRAGYGVAEAELHKAVLDQFPNLTLTVAGARDTSGNVTLGPGIGFTLPLWNRNRGGIAIAYATREQVRAEYDARLFQTRAEIRAAASGLAVARRQADELRAQLPDIARFADATARAASRGDLSAAVGESAAQSLRDRQLALTALEQQAAEQTIALELLSGGLAEGWTPR